MSEEEIYKMLLTEKIDKFPLLNEIFAIRNNKFKINDYTIYVTGLISLDVINREIEKVNLIDKLQKENKESKELYDKLFNGYNKLVQEHLELEKTIDLIIDDFQMENYFVNMTNKEVREYYKRRKKLKE